MANQMKKRTAGYDEEEVKGMDASCSASSSEGKNKRGGVACSNGEAVFEETADNLMFEDPFEDEIEEEEIVEEEDEMMLVDEEDGSEENKEEVKVVETQVWRPGVDPLGKDEVLEYDPSAYDVYYSMTAEWPSLSFDIIRDNLGAVRTKYPMTVFAVSGTQAASEEDNQITILKMSDLHKTKRKNDDMEDDDDTDDDDDEDVDGEPILESRSIKHKGGVNRIRAMPQSSHVVANWADTGKVHLWDISKQLQSLNGKAAGAASVHSTMGALQTFAGHPEEGFAIDWSPVNAGHLLTGDCKKYIYLWTPSSSTGASSWAVDKVPFTGHKASVEDLQWSPSEATVFASCSVDQTIRIWDTRRKAGSMLDIHAHNDDINVISWNRNVSYLMVSGSDDGSFKIWDLRNFKSDSPVAHFRYHTAPITSVEWHPTDESALAVASADNQVTVWDMSVEEDASEAASLKAKNELDLPPQLLFVHQGQNDVKEIHFHPQCPGLLMSTAADGFNVFKPSNIS